MDDWLTFLSLGWSHILDFQGYDHMLFLLLLAAPFTFLKWKSLLVEVTFFTVGHALTLLFSWFFDLGKWSEYVEWTIAFTIFLTACELLFRRSADFSWRRNGVILLFGLIHGLGFAGYFKSMMGVDGWMSALLFFNFGVELGQICFVLVVLSLQSLLFYKHDFLQKYWVQGIASVTIVLSIWMMLQR